MMPVRRENAAYSPPVLYTPSRASLMPVCGDAQTTTVPVRRHYVSSPDASYTGYVHEYIVPSSPPALGKPRHLHVPLPSQTGGDTPIVVHQLSRPNRGDLEGLCFTRSLSSVCVLGHEGRMNKAATNPPLPSLTVIHSIFPSPVVIQSSGDQECIAVADVVEKLRYALSRLVQLRSSSSLLLL
ncbi:hypothetical protein ARMSODRAFT_1022403 [Armillaria solidipes]|uniref:Uncharacterized protein n=1 Tax=Armillaria solidipes TaxID=1076256 RepID=A0A2H3BN38_9AGAR|nr:hypothetical protein ARMSODRAFT_1022403 [Armillaria solidipes]